MSNNQRRIASTCLEYTLSLPDFSKFVVNRWSCHYSPLLPIRLDTDFVHLLMRLSSLVIFHGIRQFSEGSSALDSRTIRAGRRDTTSPPEL